MADNLSLAQHQQALDSFSPGREKLKYTFGKIAKWAAIGAVVGGIGLAAASGLMTTAIGAFGAWSAVTLIGAGLGSAAAVPVIGWVVGGVMAAAGVGIAVASFLGLTGAALGAAAVTGLMWGAGIGAAIGAVSGFSGAQDAVDDRRDELDMNVRMALQKSDMVSAMQLKRNQQWLELQKQAQGLVSPQLGLPRGAGPEVGRV